MCGGSCSREWKWNRYGPDRSTVGTPTSRMGRRAAIMPARGAHPLNQHLTDDHVWLCSSVLAYTPSKASRPTGRPSQEREEGRGSDPADDRSEHARPPRHPLSQPALTPAAFATKWKGVQATEKASAQSHFIELCRGPRHG